MATVDDAVSDPLEAIRDFCQRPDPFDYSPAEMRPLQLAAAREMFERQRATIPVLQRRAKETGIATITSLEDLVPILLSHTTYKSYPQSFVTGRQWDKLNQWLGLVSSADFKAIDVADAVDIDDWLARLWAAGYPVTTSSGTGGKVSLLPKSQVDFDRYREYLLRFRGWPRDVRPNQDRHYFQFGPAKGAYTAVLSAALTIEAFGRPDSRHLLAEEPLSIAKVSQMAALRDKMKDGTATPEEIAAMDEESRQKSATSAARIDEMIEEIIRLRHEPLYISAMAAQMYEVVVRARAAGVPDGAFHPDTIVSFGGGKKHFKLPDDYEDQIKSFFAGSICASGYGMSEMTWLGMQCSAGHYHLAVNILPLMLDETGENLVQPHSGVVTGRFGFVDLLTDIRWGGMISSDKLVIDLDGDCPCGHSGVNIRSVGRFDSGVGDDKIQCSGTIDAYIRGAVVE